MSEVATARRFILQKAASSTGNGTPAKLDGGAREHSIYIQTSAGVSAGAVQLETAEDSAYAGTWAPLGSPVTVPAASSETVVQVTGAFGAIRARISTGISGGTVSVFLVAN